MAKIGASVGQGGKNQTADVKLVQEMLNRFTDDVKLVPLDITGKADAKTLKFITEFQRRVAGLSKPDGLIDPDGQTWRKLSARKAMVVNPPAGSKKKLGSNLEGAGAQGVKY